jgi:hypothetical protein
MLEEAVGQGTCAAEDSKTRLEEMKCNEHVCVKENQDVPLRCNSQIDVVLVLDGSGSLGYDGFESTKRFASTFVEALSGPGSNASVAVILFSGPSDWYDFYTCYYTPASASMASTCGTQEKQHFSTDMRATAQVVENLTWPMGTTLTSVALMTAHAELTLGRPGVPKLVVLVTDGIPLSEIKTELAADEVKRAEARLVLVPVSGKGLSDDGLALMERIASEPKENNFLSVDITQLDAMGTIDMLIADMCTELGYDR